MSLIDKLFGELEEREEELGRRPSPQFAERKLPRSLKEVLGPDDEHEPIREEEEMIKDIQESRTQRAKTVDKQHNAPIAKSAEEWADNPNRLDLPGVDTIPPETKERRGKEMLERARESGKVKEVEEVGRRKTFKGKFDPRPKSEKKEGPLIRLAENKDETTVAHEVGHAVDYEKGEGHKYGFSELLNPLPERLRKESDGLVEPDPEAKELREKMREPMEWLRGHEGHGSWAEKSVEKTAVFMESAATQPRATKREFPDIWEKFKEEGMFEDMPDTWGR